MHQFGVYKQTAITASNSTNLLSHYFHLLASSPELRHLRHLHARLLRSGLFSDPFLSTKLLLSYSRHGRLFPSSLRIFHLMPCRNSFTWSTLISELSKSGSSYLCFQFFRRMRYADVEVDNFTIPPVLRSCAVIGCLKFCKSAHGLSVKLGLDRNVFVGSAQVMCYNSLSQISDARKVFDEMTERDTVLWTSMLSGYAQSEKPELAFTFFNKMVHEGIVLDVVVMVSLLLACAQLSWLNYGRNIHAYAIRRLPSFPLVLGNALIDMYVKCGAFDYARKMFDSMQYRDVISWTTLILGHGLNGHVNDALSLFDEMCIEGVKPNSITFLGLLSACGHAGLVEKAWELFHRMRKLGLEPELKHYSCIADALARAGRVVEAERFINEMPFEPDGATLRALLSFCQIHGDMETAKRIANKLVIACPESSGCYMSMANLYSDVGQYDESKRVREYMKGINLQKLPGWSTS
ncbi:Pentatricopeptide repeat-containing protein [Rhynchospora pubera]|uniref:Pentatricopeptide repeat-containing protein n=1 Tax=Rhynchospora pubera TaxID=906938 RepID=A0AAV8E4Z7_9POAL|nr:Pentatricopeptide repeat-containing protein [Rhynchospora pubera]